MYQYPGHNKLGGMLRRLGFRSCAAYLESDLWWSIRRRVWLRERGKCAACGDKIKVVHHWKYTEDILRGHSIDGLSGLCQDCHSRAHRCHMTLDGLRKMIRPLARIPRRRE